MLHRTLVAGPDPRPAELRQYQMPGAGGDVLAVHRPQTVKLWVDAVEFVVDSMRKRLQDSLSVEEIGYLAHLSPYHFARVFREVTGLSPGHFLAALRISEAKHLLLTSQLSVAEVCSSVGYWSVGSFTTLFTRSVGVSPISLRRLSVVDVSRDVERALHQSQLQALHMPVVQGRVHAPPDFHGLVFVGLFPSRLAQRAPAGCALLDRPGEFRLGPVRAGSFFLLAVGLTDMTDATCQAARLVGRGAYPVSIRAGGDTQVVDIELRPMRTTDPPLLAEPSVLLTRFGAPQR
jgi:AraC family transcriptional regulator